MGAAVVALACALHEHHALDISAIGRTLHRLSLAGCFHCEFFKSCLIHHVCALAATQFRQLVDIVAGEAGRLHDRADHFSRGRAAFGGDLDREFAGCTAGFSDGRIEIQLDARMAACTAHQLADTGVDRVVERHARRSAFPQFCGPASQLCLLFHHDHVVAGFGRFQRCSQPGYAAAHHQNALVLRGVGIAFRHIHFLQFGTAHAYIVVRHFLREFFCFLGIGLAPDHAFADIGACHGNMREIKGFGLGAARAGRNHDMVDAFFFDVVTDHLYAFGVAQEGMLAHQFHLAFTRGHFYHLCRIQSFADTASLADIRCCFHLAHNLTSVLSDL